MHTWLGAREAREIREPPYLLSAHAKRTERLPKLLLRNLAVAVVVPLAEEVDDAHGILREQLTQLVLHWPVLVKLEAAH